MRHIADKKYPATKDPRLARRRRKPAIKARVPK
jgi:hypothetical protein